MLSLLLNTSQIICEEVDMKFARYEAHGDVAYGLVEGDAVMQLTAPHSGSTR